MRIRNSLKYKVSDKRGSEEDEDVHVDLYGAEPTTGEVVDVDEAIRPAVPKLLEAMRSDNKMLYECALDRFVLFCTRQACRARCCNPRHNGGDGEKTYAPRGGWISCQAMVKNLYPQRWLDQLPGDSEKPIPPTRRHP